MFSASKNCLKIVEQCQLLAVNLWWGSQTDHWDLNRSDTFSQPILKWWEVDNPHSARIVVHSSAEPPPNLLFCFICYAVFTREHWRFSAGRNARERMQVHLCLRQGCQTLVLEGPVLQVLDVSQLQLTWFRLNGSLRKIVKFCTSLLMMHWSELGALKQGSI